jgi:hypothetical protein
MASMARDAWTDERLDDLNAKVDRLDVRMEDGFRGIREEFRSVRGEMKEEFRTVREDMASQYRMIILLFGGMFGTMVIGFLSVVATILVKG